MSGEDPKCCCGGCSIETGAKVLFIVEIVFGVLGAVGNLFQILSLQGALSFVASVLVVVFASLGLYGLKARREGMLKAATYFHAAMVIYAIVSGILVVIVVLTASKADLPPEYQQHNVDTSSMAVSVAIGMGIVAAIYVWWYLIVRDAWHWVRDGGAGAAGGGGAAYVAGGQA